MPHSLEERTRKPEDAAVSLVEDLVAFFPITLHLDLPAVRQIERLRAKGSGEEDDEEGRRRREFQFAKAAKGASGEKSRHHTES